MAECVKCGYCCRIGPCSYGFWDFEKKQCIFLTDENLCKKYEEIKKLSPAFGTGCSSSLGNTLRQKVMALQFAKAYGKSK